MLISIDVYFFRIHIFGHIWSQSLTFSKLTDIWYWRTLLHAYHEFQCLVFQSFVRHVILVKFGQNLMFSILIKI